MAAGGAGCGDTVEQCRAEVERLTRELAEANREKIQAAECGLVVLEENQSLKQQYAELEAEQETLRLELEQLQEAFGQAYSTQRRVAEDGETNEETLLQESASKEAYYMGRLLELQSALTKSRATSSNVLADNEHLSTLLQELREQSNDVLELQRSRMREEIREYKFREGRLLQDYTELEEENITLQKLVSTLKQNQVEYEGLKHEIKVLEEETEILNSQLQDALRLKDMSDAQLEESLESLKSEREQKKHLRRELVHHLSMCDVAYTGSAHLTFSSAPPSGTATPTTMLSPNAEDPTRCNGHLQGGTAAGTAGSVPRANGDCRVSGWKSEGGVTSDLFNEMNMTEIQKLKQQLVTVERENVSLMTSLQESQSQLQHTQAALTEQHEKSLRLNQRVTVLRRLNRRARLHHEAPACAPSQLHPEALVELDRDEEEAEEEGGTEEDRSETLNKSQVFSYQTPGLEILQCKYRVAVTEVVELKAEVKCLRDRLAQGVEVAAEEKPRRNSLQKLDRQVNTLEKNCREGREKISSLELELQAAQSAASESRGALNAAQDELVILSEELAQLYHHVCLCNNETPNRIVLDYYRQGRGLRGLSATLKAMSADNSKVLLTPRLARRLAAVASSTLTPGESRSPSQSPSKEPLSREGGGEKEKGGLLEPPEQSLPPCTPPTRSPSISASSSSSSSSSPALEPASELRREPMNIYNLNAIIKDQVKHLQRAVDTSLQLSRQRAAARELAPLMDKDKEVCMEEILKLKSLLSTKREQIATLRLVLRANKQTAEGALSNLKSKYEAEKTMVRDTMTRLRNELKALKEDAATFSSLRAMFATRCDEYVTQLDDMQMQLAAAEDEKKTLNSLLRMAIQQKLALTQRLEDLAFDQEQTHQTRGGRLHRIKTSTPKVSPSASSSASNLAQGSTSAMTPVRPSLSNLLSSTSILPDDPTLRLSPSVVSAALASALTSPTSHFHTCSPSSPAGASLVSPLAPESPPCLGAPSFPSPRTPPSTSLKLAHSQWTMGVRTFVVDSHSISVNITPNLSHSPGPSRHITPDSFSSSPSTTTTRPTQPGSGPSSPYRSPILGLRRSTWSPSPRTRPLSSLTRSSVLYAPSSPSPYSSSHSPSPSYSSAYYGSSSSVFTPSRSYLASGTTNSYGHSTSYTPLYPRHYSSYRPRH
ncbi:protein bicaudal D homolog 1-like isoform X1 [Pseudochaenichthys georgianus]|uniref:protein bicaudal D homolog 1-like isoform X1 n=2 Tax=Pseudochaenichthys georgianus TaxID=52239 RepID=UPI00146E32CF|nr:protein bicaudal D homolog 1-like isoform X1 [Pseudochaenichthys georgianus]